MSALREGDVVRYRPEEYHCHEGMAIARTTTNGAIELFDTYWGYPDKWIAPPEFEVLFNLSDYEEIPNPYRGAAARVWERYAPADRAVVTHQHGLQVDHYIRKGAVEDRATIIANAQQAVTEAENERDSAQWHLTFRRRELDQLLAKDERATAAEVDAARQLGPHRLGCPAGDEDPDGIEACECEPAQVTR